MIPKRIFYTWFGKEALPKDFIAIKSNWKILNPDYEIIEINESNFDVNYCQFTKEAYQNGQMAFVSDVARIWVINKYGGIYLDTDVEALKSFDPLLDNHQFWAKEDAGYVATGLGFGSETDDPILNQILLKYSTLSFNSSSLASISTTQIVSKILRKYGLKNNRKFNRLSSSALIYPPYYFAPLHYWGGGKVNSKSFTVHHYRRNPIWTSKNNSWANYFIHQIMYLVPVIGEILRWIKKKSKLK